ncbi:MAG: FKBP-type peptidyl-prolyl cis-trans isomerase [Bacteroides sp]|nr:FKBP-type peptidyl-prolyl cis-trans isomerase [Bacteroides sp.]
MKKSILWLVGLLFAIPFILTSCEESDGLVNPYENWKERNQQYIDSIAAVAKANPTEWLVIHSYKFPENMEGAINDVNDYVYCKVLEQGEGIAPLFTDSVATNYRGQLIPLAEGSIVTFDQSYHGELNKDVAVPVGFKVSEVIVGWTTALQRMREGSRWEVYVPSELGYGISGSNSIPGYSTLCFDVHLVKVYTNR